METIYTAPEVDTLDVVRFEAYAACAPTLWNRGGEVRLLPTAVIRNAMSLRASWIEVVQAGVIDRVPAAAEVIQWDSCLGLPERSPKVEVHPRGYDYGSPRAG
jgi:hypothetical protein